MITGERRVTIREIQELVARVFHLSRAQLLSRTRSQHVACARQVAMYLSRKIGRRGTTRSESSRYTLSFPRIALAFDRDHSSVIHACDAVQRRCSQDDAFARMVEDLAFQLCRNDNEGRGAEVVQ